MSIQNSVNAAISAGVGGAVARSVKEAADLEKTERQKRLAEQAKLERERTGLEITGRKQELKKQADLEAAKLDAASITPEKMRFEFEAEHGEHSAEGLSDEDIFQYYQGYSVEKAASAGTMLAKNTLGKAQQKAAFEQRKEQFKSRKRYGGNR